MKKTKQELNSLIGSKICQDKCVCKNYIESIEDAWEVIESLKPKIDLIIESFSDYYIVRIEEIKVCNKSASKAICLAALEAVTGKVYKIKE